MGSCPMVTLLVVCSSPCTLLRADTLPVWQIRAIAGAEYAEDGFSAPGEDRPTARRVDFGVGVGVEVEIEVLGDGEGLKLNVYVARLAR